MRPVATTTLYTRDILRLAASVPHVGRLEGADGSSEKRAPVCGSTIAVDVILDDVGRIAALGQEVRACAFGQASAALMGAQAIGRRAAELAAAHAALAAYLAGTRADPGDWPGLDIFADARRLSARHGAILLPFAAAAEAAARAADEGTAR
jgi:NifU-like protein involved in Fe-S cluster formation